MGDIKLPKAKISGGQRIAGVVAYVGAGSLKYIKKFKKFMLVKSRGNIAGMLHKVNGPVGKKGILITGEDVVGKTGTCMPYFLE